MKSYANSQQSGQGEDKKIENEDGDDDNHIFASNLFDLCRLDMFLYYFYCSCNKLGLLKSTLVKMPKKLRYDGACISHVYKSKNRNAKRDKSELSSISDNLAATIKIEAYIEQEELKRVKNVGPKHTNACMTNTWDCTQKHKI